jgi:hypothetical protein
VNNLQKLREGVPIDPHPAPASPPSNTITSAAR